MTRHSPVVRIALFILAAQLIGCAAVQPFPHTGRAGDTITLALGSAEDVTAGNTTVTYTPDADPSGPVDLTPGITAVFNLYPDPKSRVWHDVGYVQALRGMSGHDVWVTVMALDLPPGIPPGTGMITVDSAGVFPVGFTSINEVAIDFEVLPGAGSANPLRYATLNQNIRNGDLSELTALPHALFRPDLTGLSGSLFGAVEVVVDAQIVNGTGTPAPDNQVALVSEFQNNGYTRRYVHQSWSRTNDALTVNLVAPNGMGPERARFAIVALPGAAFTGPPVVVSTRFFDLDGNEVPGPVFDVSLK